MISKLLLLASVTAPAFAWFELSTHTEHVPTPSNGAETSELAAAMSSFSASVSGDSRFQSAGRALRDYMRTRTDLPGEVGVLTMTTTYTTEPDWWKAVPTDIKNPWESFYDEQVKIVESVLTDDAPRPTAAARYAGAGVVAAAAGAAVIF